MFTVLFMNAFYLNLPDSLEAVVPLVRWEACHKVGNLAWAALQVDCTLYSWLGLANLI